jgi:hypothetical protein
MDSNLIRLPRELCDRSYEFADRSMVAGYEQNEKPASHFYSSHGLDTDVRGQAIARMAECAFCEWAGFDANVALDWGNEPDRGFDVIYGGQRIDIKQTKMTSHFLLWPGNKPLKKEFDAFVLLKFAVIDAAFPFSIPRYISREDFIRKHRVATGQDPVSKGSLIVHERELVAVPERTHDQRLRDGLYIASLTERHLAEWQRRKAVLP